MLIYMYEEEEQIKIPMYCYSDNDIVSTGIEKLEKELRQNSIVITHADNYAVPTDNNQTYFYNIIKILLVLLSVFFALLALIGAERALLNFNRHEIIILKIYGYSNGKISLTLFSSLIKDIGIGVLIAGIIEMFLYVVLFKYALIKTYTFFTFAILINCLLIWTKMYVNIILVRIRKSSLADITGF